MKNTLGASDRSKLDEYLFAVRDIESHIQKVEKENALTIRPALPEPPSSVPESMTEHSKLMFDLMIIAFQTNMTRIATMLMATEQSTRPYREIGIPEGHHFLSHHQSRAERLEKVAKIDLFYMQEYARFLEKLETTKDVDGNSLLHNSMIIYGGGNGDGNRHNHDNLPILLVGKGGGTIKSGRHLRFPKDTPLCDLFVSMLNRFDVPVSSFGDSKGKLEGLS